MQPFHLEKEDSDDVVILKFRGYFAGDPDGHVRGLVEEALKNGIRRIVFDFSECRLVNSPGVVMIMEVTLRIVDDSQGNLAISGLDPIKSSVFEMAGIFPLADQAEDIPAAIALVKIG